MTRHIKSEIGQTAPFTSPEQVAFVGVLRTASYLERRVAERLKPHGLTLAQFNVLRILRGAGPEGLCRTEVQARMLTPVPDATRLLHGLAGTGLLVRDRDAGDRRLVTVRITQAGLELLERLDAPVAQMHRDHLGHLTPAELRQLADLLGKARGQG